MPPPPPEGGRALTELWGSSPQTRMAGERPRIDVELWTEVHARFRLGQGHGRMARAGGRERKTVTRIRPQERPAPSRRTVSRSTGGSPELEERRQRAREVDSHADRIVYTRRECARLADAP